MRLIDGDELVNKLRCAFCETCPSLCHYPNHDSECAVSKVFHIIDYALPFPPYRAWVSCKDMLPEEGVKVLTLDKFGHIKDRELRYPMFGGSTAYFRPDGLLPGRDVTHWMQMLEMPEKGGKDDG